MLGNLVKEQCSVFCVHCIEGILRRNVECFQRYHNCIMEIQICFFRNRSLFNELQFVLKCVCKICDFGLSNSLDPDQARQHVTPHHFFCKAYQQMTQTGLK